MDSCQDFRGHYRAETNPIKFIYQFNRVILICKFSFVKQTCSQNTLHKTIVYIVHNCTICVKRRVCFQGGNFGT